VGSYRLTGPAESDLAAITEYTACRFGEQQARRYAAELHRAATMAADFPFLARAYTTVAGRTLRIYSCGRHGLFFVPGEEEIVIVRILHLMLDFDRHPE